MRKQKRRSIAGAAAAVAAAIALTAVTAAGDPAAAKQPRRSAAEPLPLRILISNDDGYAHPYIRQLRDALARAGHTAVIVAPAEDQSGRGTGMNFQRGATIRAAEEEPGIWSVTGSPGDAVRFGVTRVFAGAPPDLVVSGINAGPNTGPTANHSGTVGATVAAGDLGIPGIAVSADFDLSDPQDPFPTVPQAAAFTARTVDRLAATAIGGELLPAGTALNVNYPAVPATGVAFTNVGRAQQITVGYEPDPATCDTCYKVGLGLDPDAPEPVGSADTTALKNGRASVSLLTADWGARGWAAGQGGPTYREVQLTKSRLSGLAP